MKGKIFVIVSSLIVVGVFCALSGEIFAEGKEKTEKSVSKTNVPRETRMKASGVVREIDLSTLVIERNITGEVMEFQLEKSLSGISVGDKVSVSYIQTNGRNIAKRVVKNIPKQKVPSPPPSPANASK